MDYKTRMNDKYLHFFDFIAFLLVFWNEIEMSVWFLILIIIVELHLFLWVRVLSGQYSWFLHLNVLSIFVNEFFHSKFEKGLGSCINDVTGTLNVPLLRNFAD